VISAGLIRRPPGRGPGSVCSDTRWPRLGHGLVTPDYCYAGEQPGGVITVTRRLAPVCGAHRTPVAARWASDTPSRPWRHVHVVPGVLPPGPIIFEGPGGTVTALLQSQNHQIRRNKPKSAPIPSSQHGRSRGSVPPGTTKEHRLTAPDTPVPPSHQHQSHSPLPSPMKAGRGRRWRLLDFWHFWQRGVRAARPMAGSTVRAAPVPDRFRPPTFAIPGPGLAITVA
jgi:hypothetical protein